MKRFCFYQQIFELLFLHSARQCSKPHVFLWVQFFCDYYLRRKQNAVFYIVYPLKWIFKPDSMFLEITKQLYWLGFPNQGRCNLVCPAFVYRVSISLIQARICPHLVKRINVQLVLWRLVLNNIVLFKQPADFIPDRLIAFSPDDQQVDLQSLLVEAEIPEI